MASSDPVLPSRASLIAGILALSFGFASTATSSCFPAIFSFGDSIADTGNLLFFEGSTNQAGQFPYGETFFDRPTGRYCNGRLIVDFIAEATGLPLLPTYLQGSARGCDFRRGVNFAVGGATALDNDVFREKGLHVYWTEYSLGTQIQWFKQLLPSLCTSSPAADCNDLLTKSLFLMGEIGGNDYFNLFHQGRTLEETQTFVPGVISVIVSAIDVLIGLGARILVVPGNFPIGCNAAYLTMFENQPIEVYDPHTGCIRWLNEFVGYHNRLLQDELERLRLRHSQATIIYADYYGATMPLYRSPSQYGFETALAACCGGSGPYNYVSSSLCGNKGSTVCNDPSSFINWDGAHLTEAAYKIIADGLLTGPYANPHITIMCSLAGRNIDQLQIV